MIQLPDEVLELLHVSGEGEDDDTNSHEEILEDICDSIGSLRDLTSYIEDLHSASDCSESPPPSPTVSTIPETQPYRFHITTKYKGLDDRLIDALTILNWHRHQRVQDWAESHLQNTGIDVASPEHASLPEEVKDQKHSLIAPEFAPTHRHQWRSSSLVSPLLATSASNRRYLSRIW